MGQEKGKEYLFVLTSAFNLPSGTDRLLNVGRLARGSEFPGLRFTSSSSILLFPSHIRVPSPLRPKVRPQGGLF